MAKLFSVIQNVKITVGEDLVPELEHSAGTDEEKEVKLDPSIVYAAWTDGAAYGGQKAGFEVATALVGNGAKIEVTGKSENGESLGKVKGKVLGNKFIGELEIPEEVELRDKVYFEVSLPGNSIYDTSNSIPAFPPIAVSNMKWSASEVIRGDILTISADITGLSEGSNVKVKIYEFDDEGLHDRIVEIETQVKDNKLKMEWEFEYYGDVKEIPIQNELDKYDKKYLQPQFYFTVTAGSEEYGKEKQDSGLIIFQDWMELECEDPYGEPAADYEYKVTLPNGEVKEGMLDSEGKATLEGVPPGECEIELIPKEDEDNE